MNNEKQKERRVICSVEKGYGNSESDVGKLRAYYEISSAGEVLPINSIEHFCDTEQVFVTGQFTELKEKFNDRLFEATCILTNFDVRDGDCNYVTRITSCTDIKGLVCCQIFDSQLPKVSFPKVAVDRMPLTKTILLREDGYLFGPFEYVSEYRDTSQGNRMSV